MEQDYNAKLNYYINNNLRKTKLLVYLKELAQTNPKNILLINSFITLIEKRNADFLKISNQEKQKILRELNTHHFGDNNIVKRSEVLVTKTPVSRITSTLTYHDNDAGTILDLSFSEFTTPIQIKVNKSQINKRKLTLDEVYQKIKSTPNWKQLLDDIFYSSINSDQSDYNADDIRESVKSFQK